jgi:hypothetical protein
MLLLLEKKKSTENTKKKIVGCGDLRQMSEYPIPHGEHCDSCILRKSWKSAFLHPKREL